MPEKRRRHGAGKNTPHKEAAATRLLGSPRPRPETIIRVFTPCARTCPCCFRGHCSQAVSRGAWVGEAWDGQENGPTLWLLWRIYKEGSQHVSKSVDSRQGLGGGVERGGGRYCTMRPALWTTLDPPWELALSWPPELSAHPPLQRLIRLLTSQAI